MAATTHAAIIVDYEFDDPTGTGLSALANTGTGTVAPWNNDPDATTNGAGMLDVTGPVGFKIGGLTGANAVTSGSAYLRVDFDSWGPSTGNALFVFGLRLSTMGPGFQSWRLQLKSGDTSDGDPLGAALEESGSFSLSGNFDTLAGGLPDASGQNGVMPNGGSVIMGVDLDADTTSVWWDPNRTGTYTPVRTNLPIDSNAGTTDFSVVNGLQLSTNGGPFRIDRYAFGTDFAEIAGIPEPGTAAIAIALFGGLAATVRRVSPLHG